MNIKHVLEGKVIPSRVTEILKWAKGPDVLHVGCSDHVVRIDSQYWIHDHLCKKFDYVSGIDLSADNIHIMEEMGYKNLNVANAETFDLHEKFDSIIAGELIEHLSNPGLFLEQARKHLKPGGRLIITTPTPFSLLNFLYAHMKYPRTCQNDQHAMWFCAQTLRTLFARYGFKEEYMSLIKDYELENDSIKYKIFAYIMVYFGFLLPNKLKCNDMLFVLKAD
jgi:2-polyprenyl-3-methyl-5-hydroxy-6-metoxy-1,4-benzoquinol methylase